MQIFDNEAKCITDQLMFVGMNVSAERRDVEKDVIALSTPEAPAIVELVRHHVHRYRKLQRALLLLAQL